MAVRRDSVRELNETRNNAEHHPDLLCWADFQTSSTSGSAPDWQENHLMSKSFNAWGLQYSRCWSQCSEPNHDTKINTGAEL